MSVIGTIIERSVWLGLVMCLIVPGVAVLFLWREERIALSESSRFAAALSPAEKRAFAVISTIASVFGACAAFGDLLATPFAIEDAWSLGTHMYLLSIWALVIVSTKVWSRCLIAMGVVEAEDATGWLPRYFGRGGGGDS